MTAIVAEFPDFLVRYKQKSIRTILDDGDVEALGAMAVVLLMGAHERRVMGMRAGVLLPVTFLEMTSSRHFQMQLDGWRDGFRDEHARLVSVRRRDDDTPAPDLAEVIVPLENRGVSGPLGKEESPHSLAEATRLWGRRGRVGLDMTEAASLGGAMLGVLRVVCAARGPVNAPRPKGLGFPIREVLVGALSQFS